MFLQVFFVSYISAEDLYKTQGYNFCSFIPVPTLPLYFPALLKTHQQKI